MACVARSFLNLASIVCTHDAEAQVKPVKAQAGHAQSEGTVSVLKCGIGEHAFDVRMAAEHAVLIKMADFGTADTNCDRLGKPIGIDHFTTLENTPPELLFHGSNAQQSFAMDTFSAGLAVLHLFTGQASDLLEVAVDKHTTR
jgi:hypothetical protein